MRTLTLRSVPRPLSRFAPWRMPLGSAAIVILLSALFAGAILAALQPHPAVDDVLASVQGGL